MDFEIIADQIEAESLKLSWKLPSKNTKKFALARSWQIPKTTALFLHDLILKSKPRNILELGTSTGYSTIWLANAAKQVNATVDTIEFFIPKILVAKENFQKVGLDKYITLHEGMIIDVLSKWHKNIDFAFFDADKQRYTQYYELIKPLLNKNSIIVVDNAINFADRMKKFLKYLQDRKVNHEIVDIDNGLLIIRS